MGLQRLVGNAIHRFRYKTLREKESHREDINVSLIDNAHFSHISLCKCPSSHIHLHMSFLSCPYIVLLHLTYLVLANIGCRNNVSASTN